MKTLIVLNDHGIPAAHAAMFALALAQKIRANIIVASLPSPDERIHVEDIQLNANGNLVLQRSELLKAMFANKKRHTDFRPVIQEFEVEHFTGDELFQLTIDKNIYIVIRGVDEFLSSALLHINLSINMLLGKIKCPLLIIPTSWGFHQFRDLVYLTDLRFCGLKKVGFIADLAKEWNAHIVIAHSTVSGLPEIDAAEADDLFRTEVCNHINYENISLNMLNRGEIPDMIKLVVHDLHADLLIFVNQHFHFNTFTKQYFKDRCALYKPVPMLIFPY